MDTHTTWDVTSEIEAALREWRTRALNVILIVGAVVALLALLSPLAVAIREPDQWPQVLIFLGLYLLLVGLAVVRRLDFRLRGWGLLLLGYAAGIVSFTRAGLAGNGRIFLIAAPVLAIILIGVRSGIVATALSLAIMALFAGFAQLGWLEDWLIYPDNPVDLGYWIESIGDFTLCLALVMVVLERFQRLHIKTQQAERQALAELARTNTELEMRVERRTADLSQANVQLTQEIAERKLAEDALRESQRQMERRVAELATLTDVGRALSSTLRVDEVLQLIYDQTRRVMYAENMIIMLYDQARDEIECGFSNNPDDAAPGARFPASTGLTGYIIKHRNPVLLRGNVMEGIRKLGLEMVGQPSASWLGVPMLTGEHVLGVIIVQHYTTPNVYDESHQVLLEIVASQAAIAIENAYLFEEVQREKQYSEALVLNSPAAIVVGDIDHKIVTWNPAAEELFGYTQAEASGRYIDDLIAVGPSGQAKAIQAEAATYTQQITQGDVVRAITRRSHRDGAMMDVELLAVPLIVEEEQVGYLAIYHDITALQRARQEAEAANRAKSAFLSTVSHELRTPLTSVLGFAKIVKRRLDDVIFPLVATDDHKVQRAVKQVGSNIEIIVSEGERLTALINDVLDLAKIEAGKIEWHMESASVREIVERSVAATTSLFENSALELEVDVEQGLPIVLGDRDRLIQVMVNLLSNAFKFTAKGTVTCRARQVEDEIWVSVTDTGIGIAPDDYDKVFEQFVQVGDVLTERPRGTGLGLPICKNIIEYHGGRIWVESELGVGSTFTFTLSPDIELVSRSLDQISPVLGEIRRRVDETLRLRSRQALHPGDEAGNLILVVDDEANIRELLRQELTQVGYRVIEAANGAEALSMARRKRPDLIILDVMMPNVSGFDVTSALRADQSMADIPILILSIVEDREHGLTLGADAYLTKPIDTDRLLETISALLAQESAQPKAVVVGQDRSALEMITVTLREQGFQVVEAYDARGAIATAQEVKPDLVIVDEMLSRLNDAEILKALRFQDPSREYTIIVLSGTKPEAENHT